MEPDAISPVSPGYAQALSRLRDIQGIDGVPWWPPAPGWWLMLGALVLLVLAAWGWRSTLRLRIPIPGVTLGHWRWDAARALRDLRRRLRGGLDAKTAAAELSELLRRIAMAREGRAACAGLTGADWLAWLAERDPAGFPWRERGRVLIEAPYAPPGAGAGADLAALVDAAYAWVAASGAPTDPRGPRIPGLTLRRARRSGAEA
jgi:hypothetical protein